MCATEALLFYAAELLYDNEWVSAGEAGEGGHLLIFFVLVNPSPFRAGAEGLTPSPPCDNGLSCRVEMVATGVR